MKRKFETMKRSLILLLFALLVGNVNAERKDFPVMFAHRGGHTPVIPENSLAGVASAKRFGYVGIECDVKYTSDSVMVLMHDKSLNRTARNAKDYSPVKETVNISDITFDDLRHNYVLASENPAYRTPVPTLEEMLVECKKHGMVPMLHSNIAESFELAQKILGDNWICFGASKENMLKTRGFSDCLILASVRGGRADDHIAMLDSIGGRCGVSTMNYGLLTEEYCKALKNAGYQVQASIFPAPHEARAFRNGITYQLTDFSLNPEEKFKVIDIWRQENCNLRPGDTLTNKWATGPAYGGIIVNLDFEGKVEVLLNNMQRYILSDDDNYKEIMGLRFNGIAPSIKITALENSTVKSVVAKIYEF